MNVVGDTVFLTRIKVSIKRKENCWFGMKWWILARKSADGLLPIEDSVVRRKDRVDQILTNSGLEGDSFVQEVFSFASSLCLP